LLEAAAVGAVDDDLLGSLARRLGLLEKRLSAAQRTEVENLLGSVGADWQSAQPSLRGLANAMLDAIDPDQIALQAGDGATPEQLEAARQGLMQRAVFPLAASPALRDFLLEREILIDETSVDTVLTASFDSDATDRARQLVESFQQFIRDNQDEITALQILFNRPYAARRLGFEQVRELAERLNQRLRQGDPLYLTEQLWRAYQQVERDRVRGAGEKRILADLVSLVRHAALDEDLEPYSERVQRRYQEWLAGKDFTPQQRVWLDEIARHVGVNLAISLDDLNYYAFQPRGGQVAALRLFGPRLPALLEEMNEALSV
jgi:type I restriction enzyme R subunit